MNDMPNWYNRAGDPIDVEAANSLLANANYARVALTDITSKTDPSIRHRVSTVWLGLDHGHGDSLPVLFETMVFHDGDTSDEKWCRRYSTEEEARIGHAEAVTVVAATVPSEQINDLAAWPEKGA